MPEKSTYIPKTLNNIAIQYKSDEYIFPSFMKDIPTMNDSGNFWSYDKDWTLPNNMEKAPGSAAQQITWGASNATYLVRKLAVKDNIPDDDMDNVDKPLDLKRDTTENLVDVVMRKQERLCSELLFTTTGFSNNETLNTATSFNYNTTTSDPIGKMVSVTSFVHAQCGKFPTHMVINQPVLDALKENNNVYSRIQYTDRQFISIDLLTAIFDLEQVLVGRAYYQTHQEGLTATQTSIWGSDAIVGHFAGAPSKKKLSAAAMFRNMKQGSPYRVKQWHDEETENTYIEVQTKMTPRIMASLAGYYLKTVALI